MVGETRGETIESGQNHIPMTSGVTPQEGGGATLWRVDDAVVGSVTVRLQITEGKMRGKSGGNINTKIGCLFL